jgi:hypothetical protein
MGGSVEATWGHDDRAIITSVEDLDALLDRIDADARRIGRPQDVQLRGAEHAGTLGIVVGHDRSVLNHIPEHLDPPYMTSRGEDDEDRPFTFYVAGDHHSEAAWWQTIPADVAREAARVFLITGQLDDRIRWEEV